MKGTTEPRVREALTKLSEDLPLIVYKPPDDARNWKPADFLVWFESGAVLGGIALPGSAMIEVKDNPNKGSYPFSDLRPRQRQAMRDAAAIYLPYWVVMWWRSRQVWTVSRADWMMEFVDDERTAPIKSFHWLQLSGKMGVDCSTANLPGTIGAALRGEIG